MFLDQNELNLCLEQMSRGGGAFLTVNDGENLNTMTIAWGGIGFVWNRHVFTAYVSPLRFSAGILDKSLEFTVSIPCDSSFQTALALCGSKSGRDLDKIKAAGLSTIASKSGIITPIIAGAHWQFECKVLSRNPLTNDGFVAKNVLESVYHARNVPLHVVYIGEILAAYKSE